MDIKFQTIIPIPPLKGYIEKIWVFESSTRMPTDDMKLVVPNGRLLLIIPFRNGLTGKKYDKQYLAKTNRIALVGISDCSSIVDAETDGPTGTLGVEFNAIGAYRFFHIRLKEIKNQLYYLEDIIGKAVKDIEQQIEAEQNIGDKIGALQRFLLSLFLKKDEDVLFERCLHQIAIAKGNLSIRQLERQTGYSGRWLNMKFEERLGMSPKNFSSIVRFQQYYQALLSNHTDFFIQKQFYLHYHDESHFIKEFKRFTGFSPLKLMKAENNFGRTFYKD
jgi:AraC-like DNA-binding protein